MRFTVLGPLRGWSGESELPLGPPKQRAVLALLLVRAGQPVALHEIVDLLWPDDPPGTAVNVVHRHVAALRRTLEPSLAARAPSRWVTRDAAGYRLDVPAGALDLGRFRELTASADTAGDAASAARCLVEALSLWAGPVVADLTPEVRRHPAFVAVEGEYLAAVRRAADHALAAGHRVAGDLLPGLREAAARHPLDEAVQARLMLVLAAVGRSAEALDLFDDLRFTLDEELGLVPGAELQAARQQVLEVEPVIPVPPVVPAGPADESVAVVPPAQLPADLASFTGRRHELDVVSSLLGGLETGTAPRVVVMSGMGGVGKTTLAVHWAHRVAARFPDGQLYVNLRGFHPSGAVMGPAETLRSFLDALGVPTHRIPAGLEAQASLYRSLLAGRRMLILLDNARDSDHVRHLLPGTTGSLVIVTSRNQLIDLVATEGAHPVTLDPLPRAEALRFLAARLGTDRTTLEAGAAAEVVDLTGRLPLTLALVCAHAAVNPAYSLQAVASALREIGGLDGFSGETAPTDVRSVFSWSYHALSPEAARLFRLLGQHAGPDCSLAAASSLAMRPRPRTRQILGELLRASLIFETRPGRYGCHELLRAYAAELAAEAGEESEQARTRLLDHYLHSADAAAGTLAPTRDRVALPAPVPGTVPETFETNRAAASWLETERPALVAVIRQDQHHGSARHTWQIAAVIENYLDRTGSWQVQLALQTLALEAARRSGDLSGQAHASRALGFAQSRVGLDQEATRSLTEALVLFERLGDLSGKAYAHRQLAFQANGRGEHRVALAQYRTASALYRDLGDLSGLGWVRNEVGWTHILLGEYETALTECEASIELHRRVGNRNGEAAAWDSLGYAQHHLHRTGEALGSYATALAIYRDIADRYLEADTLVHIGDSHAGAGRPSAAVTAWDQALAILEDLGHPDAELVRVKVQALASNPGLLRDRS
ncbi:AfsR/SARP family transcriptional regulator [Kineosporia succinea]|uniref:DNA-binding SARP family transcriptional activator/tetratricopeptide (TPR) repeat protein n=1 Tax=Kineosporia succinea TaxID=84632 RepID=A0ABT9PBE1_9ACTN|nr:AfsR/SARP family transcriptional regulator [Kineosporia succinea]MDP9830005.1 DNA-binding SARP family transcriptional activator/tetratricopeptide (TPR) repeat protein [Kineosporia succinea]